MPGTSQPYTSPVTFPTTLSFFHINYVGWGTDPNEPNNS